jgi:hypothetical protein
MANLWKSRLLAATASLLAAACIVPAGSEKVDINNLITGPAAFLDYRGIKPGGFRKITVAYLPAPFATRSASNAPNGDFFVAESDLGQIKIFIWRVT